MGPRAARPQFIEKSRVAPTQALLFDIHLRGLSNLLMRPLGLKFTFRHI